MNPRINKFGDKFWYNEKGEHHREDGPAVEYSNTSKYWYKNNELHREDGPAVEYVGGEKCWFYYGKCIDCDSQEEFERLIKLRMFW